MKTYEFGSSLENLQIHSKLTKRCLLDVIFQKNKKIKNKKRKNAFGESPKSFQTQKNMRAQLFLSGCTHIFFEKTVVHAYFLEFGESLERVWRFSKLIFSFHFFEK
jgi:isochorismate hydrolase